MAYPLSKEQRETFGKWLLEAEPYEDDDPILDQFDGERDSKRVLATMAQKALEGRLK